MSMAVWVGAAVGATAVGVVTDFIFSGTSWIHKYYDATPEVWRPEIMKGEDKKALMLMHLLSLFSIAAFVALAHKIGQTDVPGAAKLAAMIWLIGPLPGLIMRELFMKVHRMVTVAHAVSALVKLEIAAAAVVLAAKYGA